MSETALDPEDVAGYVTLAHDLTTAGASAEALAAVQAAVRLCPDRADLHLWIGSYFAKESRKNNAERPGKRGGIVEAEAAAAAYRKAVEIDPTDATTLSYLGRLEWWLGNKTEAIQLLKASLAAGATDFRTFEVLIRYQSRTRDYRGMLQTINALNALPESEGRDEHYRQVYRFADRAEIALIVAAVLAAFLIWRKWRGSSRGFSPSNRPKAFRKFPRLQANASLPHGAGPGSQCSK